MPISRCWRVSTFAHPLPCSIFSHCATAPTAVLRSWLRASDHVLDPYPFAEPLQILQFPARQVKGEIFPSSAHFEREFHAAPVEILSVTPSAN